MELADLNNEVAVDDLLIPNQEITNRRLIKQTPKYNVYKADWFGDVLVYEPIVSEQSALIMREQLKPSMGIRQQNDSSASINQELSSRLCELDLDLSDKLTQQTGAKLSPRASEFYDQNDSAYSSISSTPQYHTKNIASNFEFPNCSRLSSSPSLCSMSSSLSDISAVNFNSSSSINLISMNKYSSFEERIQYSKEKQVEKQQHAIQLVLNKSSYTFERGDESQLEDVDMMVKKSNSLFELNELRLIAHENFMLFMGASVDFETTADSTSLVMEMNQPRAESLYNLLHATSQISPVERFFSTNKLHRLQPSFSVEAKLNFCQQVTNAMTYLHDRNIVHAKLTSVNIYIQSNHSVKISLIDDDEKAIANNQTQNSIDFNLSALTYLSPELIRTIRGSCRSDSKSKIPQIQIDTKQLSKMSDVFSFGTLLYELFEEELPFSERQTNKLALDSPSPTASLVNSSPLKSSSFLSKPKCNIKTSAYELIYLIGSGQIGSHNLCKLDRRCPTAIIEIIAACWSLKPEERPQFKQLAFA